MIFCNNKTTRITTIARLIILILISNAVVVGVVRVPNGGQEMLMFIARISMAATSKSCDRKYGSWSDKPSNIRYVRVIVDASLL